MKKNNILSTSPEDTFTAGINFAKDLNPGDIIGLYGNLGSGKTQFVKGICEYFKVKDLVSSPTFVILNEYEGTGKDGDKIIIFHYDLYRIKHAAELKEIGLDNLNANDSICLIEWPKLTEEYFSENLFKVKLSHGENENERLIEY